GHTIRAGARSAPRAQQAEQRLNVMADLVRDHVRAGEVSRASKSIGELVEERQVEIALSVLRTVERAGGRLRRATRGVEGVAEEHDPRSLVSRAEKCRPGV